MTIKMVAIQRYAEHSGAAHDQEFLQASGIHAEAAEVRDANSETGAVYELRVDSRIAREAYRILKEYYESEKDEKFELMGDWGD